MAMPERLNQNISPCSMANERIAALAHIDRRLELVDAIENPIERFCKRDKLLDLRDQLQADIDGTASPPELP